MKIHAFHIVDGPRSGFSLNQPSYGVWEGYDLEIPDSLICGVNRFDEPILTLNEKRYPLADVLTIDNGKPCLKWYNGTYHKIAL